MLLREILVYSLIHQPFWGCLNTQADPFVKEAWHSITHWRKWPPWGPHHSSFRHSKFCGMSSTHSMDNESHTILCYIWKCCPGRFSTFKQPASKTMQVFLTKLSLVPSCRMFGQQALYELFLGAWIDVCSCQLDRQQQSNNNKKMQTSLEW